MKGFNKASYTYAALLKKVKTARRPYTSGKPLNSSMRGYLREDPDYTAPVIDIRHEYRGSDKGYKVCTVYPDNIVEMVATPNEIWSRGTSLSQQLNKVLPLVLHNFDTGRYKLITEADLHNYQGLFWWQQVRGASKEAQEYFQHLKVNLCTGKVINPKDMTPVVDEEKRKEWLAGLKKFRLKLRTLARLGVLRSFKDRTVYTIDKADLQHLADAIMRGECDETCVKLLVEHTSDWQVGRSGKTFDACVLNTFENMLKSNSRELRSHAGVIDLVK